MQERVCIPCINTFPKTVLRREEAQDPCELSLLNSCHRGDIRDWETFRVSDKNISNFGFNGKADASGLVKKESALKIYHIRSMSRPRSTHGAK
jgi:hypothetical protein